MQRYVFILFLPILTVRDVLQLAGVTPAADDAVDGARIDTEGCGEFGVCLAVEIWWEASRNWRCWRVVLVETEDVS